MSMPRRRILVWLAALPLVLLLCIGLLAWAAGSESTLRFFAARAEALSGGRVVVQGVRGSLYGPLRIDSLEVRGDEKHFRLHALALDWSPRALGQHKLLIREFSLAELRVIEVKPSAEPLGLPDTLRLPLGLELPLGHVDRLVVQTGQGEWTFSGMAFGLHKPDRTYRVDLRALRTPWGDAMGWASLGEERPFALQGAAELRHASGLLTATAAGRLEGIRLKAQAALAGGRGQADLLLTPFAQRPLAEAQVSMDGVDPSLWDRTWPSASLDGSARLLPTPGAGTREPHFTGRVLLANHRPGPWDRGLLPLARVEATADVSANALDLQAMALDLGRAGHFRGQGRIDGQGASLDLKTDDFDPRGLYSRLRPLRLAGAVRVHADGTRQHLWAELGYQRYRLRLSGARQAHTLHIEEALLTSGAGSLGLYGTLDLGGTQAFDLAGALSGFDPSAFGAYPAARVNASFSAQGRLFPSPETRLNFAVADSRFRGQALAGQGHLRLAEGRLWDSDASLRLGDNRLALQGAFGRSGDRLKLQAHATQLEVIHGDLSGRLDASGELQGSLAAPSGHLHIQAQGLGWGKDYRMARLAAKARLDQGLSGDLSLNASLGGLRFPGIELEDASIRAQGRRQRHKLALTARNGDMDLAAELVGAWEDRQGKPAWSGQLLGFSNRGRYPAKLLAPARLEATGLGVRLENALLSLLDAAFSVEEASYGGGELATRGSFHGLAAGTLKHWPGWPRELGGDLVLDGTWNLKAGEGLDGNISLARQRGDLVVALAGQPAIALGLKHLGFKADAVDGRIRANLEAEGTTLGRLGVAAESRGSRRDGVWGLAGDAPIQASGDLALESLAWAAPFIDPSGASRLDGKLAAQIKAAGTLASPRLTGTLTGRGFSLAWPAQGLGFREGSFQAQLRQDHGQDVLELKSFSIRGGEGSLSGQGRLALRDGQPDMGLALRADRLTVLSRPDRLVILSGDGSLGLADRRLLVQARLKADRGLVELAGDDAPVVSEDVVVLGREKKNPAPQGRGGAYGVVMDLDLNLGDRFFLKGKGLDAQLGGVVKLSGRPSTPLAAHGSIRVVKGAYSAYGQKLDIDRGILNFQGPLDNPGLNIVALRKNQEVEAGVAVTGTAQAPVVKLVSNPTVPDSEKLSWLVLGHGLSDTGGQEFDALQLAAGALLGVGQSVTLQQRIAHAAGLEEVSLKGAGSLETAVLTLGKRLSSRAYLSYEQGLAGTDTLVKINYTLTRRLSLQAQAGTTPAVDLFYTFSFD